MFLSGSKLFANYFRRNHTTHELLFGKDTSTDEENESLFLKAQDYILKSKRFVH